MRHFKVKDILFTPISDKWDGGCSTNVITTWEHGCFDDSDTKIPCKDTSNETEVPCAINGNTEYMCMDDDETYLPCVYGSTRDGSGPNDCVEGLPDSDNDTKYHCVKRTDTKIPCLPGTDTKIHGKPDDPKKGCLTPPPTPQEKTQIECGKNHSVTKFRCIDDSDSKYACKNNSDTAIPCGNRQTTYECASESKTNYRCWNNDVPEAKRTKFACKNASRTNMPCKTANTRACASGDSNSTIYGCGFSTWTRGTPFASLSCESENTLGSTVAGNIGCPPLSTLRLGPEDPEVLDELEKLHSDLNKALGLVETHHKEIEIHMKPKTLDEVEVLEDRITSVLSELRKIKSNLSKKNTQKINRKSNTKRKKKRNS